MSNTLHLVDFQDLLDKIQDGEDLRDIAKFYGVSYSALWRYLHDDREGANHTVRVKQAFEISAERLLQRGRDLLLQCLDKSSGMDGNVAKSLAQEYARLATVRNAAYGDKPTTAIQINNSQQGLSMPTGNITPIEASKAYSRLLED